MAMSHAVFASVSVVRSHFFAILFIILLLVVFASLSPFVLTKENVFNVLSQSSYLMIVASAQTLVLLTRGYDLSLGNTVSLVSVVTALAIGSPLATGHPILLGFGAGLLAALAVGIANGLLVAYARLNPFIVTLGTMNVVLALSSTVSGGFPVAGLPAEFRALAALAPLGVPVQIWILAGAALALHVVLTRTVFGRSLYLVGANPVAAAVAGVRTRLMLASAYVACSLLAGLCAILLTARTGSGEPTLGGNLTLEAIAAAVVGGVSTRGGQGTALAPLLGAVLIALLSNGMDMVRLDGYVQQIALGAIIVLILAFDRLRGSS